MKRPHQTQTEPEELSDSSSCPSQTKKRSGTPRSRIHSSDGGWPDTTTLKTWTSKESPDRRMMAQVLSTLSISEKDRFEAFRRGTFRSDAIARYISYRLVEISISLHRPNHNSFVSPWSPLKDLVVPGTGDEIVAIVSSLAKTYAQRLIHQCSRKQTDKPITPDQLRTVQQNAFEMGLDPGFFMEPMKHNMTTAFFTGMDVGGGACAVVRPTGRKIHDIMNATIAAQELYDRVMNNVDDKIKNDITEDKEQNGHQN